VSEETPKEEAQKPRPATLTFNKPGSISTLKRQHMFKLKLPDPKVFLSELNGESDRAAVILASAQLDDLLANAIAMKMTEANDILIADVETIFRPSGPLGSFSARAEVANLFGIIENQTYEQLFILREMRNACAHSKHPITFKDPLLRNVAMHLFAPRGATPMALVEKDMKMAFSLEVAFLVLVLGQGSRAAADAVRSETYKELVAEFGSSPGKRPEP
jgi:DNA-binding MltR family transcriptional regulator